MHSLTVPVRNVAAIAAACCAAATLCARAAVADTLPTYSTMEDSVKGYIVSIDGKFALTIRDAKGYLDHVALHQGTIILPRGLRLQPGMPVTIYGSSGGSVFQANEVETPYIVYGSFRPSFMAFGGWLPGNVGFGIFGAFFGGP
jgi:hypothetical protein